MGGILGLAVKKGSGVFKGEGHWAMQPLSIMTQIFSLYSLNTGNSIS